MELDASELVNRLQKELGRLTGEIMKRDMIIEKLEARLDQPPMPNPKVGTP